MTYRRGPHSTSDDPGRYRSLASERADAGTDPVDLLRERLLADGLADAAFIDAAWADARAEEETLRTAVAGLGSRPGAEMFDFVFSEPTDTLRGQSAAWRKESEHA
jgi:pyruvate dehydrogenase E1 component alpha subunit